MSYQIKKIQIYILVQKNLIVAIFTFVTLILDVILCPLKDEKRREMRVHKCLLSLNPNVFKLLTERRAGTKTEWYAELQVSYDTLENILNFMYTGNCQFKQEIGFNFLRIFDCS